MTKLDLPKSPFTHLYSGLGDKVATLAVSDSDVNPMPGIRIQPEGVVTTPETSDLVSAEYHIRKALDHLGLYEKMPEWKQQHIKDTPRRIAKVWQEFFKNVGTEPENMTSFSVREGFDQDIILVDTIEDREEPAYAEQDLVICSNIHFNSICSHHLLTFNGVAHLAYLPGKQVIGLSKIPRIIRHFAKQPQIQEELTKDIVNFFFKAVNPQFVYLYMTASHSCCANRGVESATSSLVTSARRFEAHIKDPENLISEAISAIRLGISANFNGLR